MSITFCEFQKLAFGNVISWMQTSSEIRRTRLEMLIKKHVSVAELNTALNWPRTDPKLAQIRNANTRAGRAKPYQMGDAMAREIEDILGLEHGWMDTPPTYAELDPDPMISELIKVALLLKEDGKTEDLAKLIRISHTFAEPGQANGTTGQ